MPSTGTGVDISVRNTLISHVSHVSHALHESQVLRMSQIPDVSHVFAAPEAAIGGSLSLVQDGDEIELDISARSLELKVWKRKWLASDYKASV